MKKVKNTLVGMVKVMSRAVVPEVQGREVLVVMGRIMEVERRKVADKVEWKEAVGRVEWKEAVKEIEWKEVAERAEWKEAT